MHRLWPRRFGRETCLSTVEGPQCRSLIVLAGGLSHGLGPHVARMLTQVPPSGADVSRTTGHRPPATPPASPTAPPCRCAAVPLCRNDLTVTVSPGAPDPLCRKAVAEQLAHQHRGVRPAPVPRAEHPARERTGHPARSARPSTVTLSLTATPAISAPPSRRPARKQTWRRDGHRRSIPDSAAHVKPRHAASAARPLRVIGGQAHQRGEAEPVLGRPWRTRGTACAPKSSRGRSSFGEVVLDAVGAHGVEDSPQPEVTHAGTEKKTAS